MSSRLLSWTKGERQYIMNALHSEKRPSLLSVDAVHSRSGSDGLARHTRSDTSYWHLSKSSTRADNSISLQDAAVRSATSSLSEADTRSSSSAPAIHLSRPRPSETQQSGTRVRSRTAPPTPLSECPTTTEPAELPGSLLIGMKSISSLCKDEDVGDLYLRQPQPNSEVGPTIVRPHSSPHETGLAIPRYPRHPRKSMDSYYAATASLSPPFPSHLRSKSASPQLGSAQNDSLRNDSTEEAIGDCISTPLSSTLRRPPPQVPAWQSLNDHQVTRSATSQDQDTETLRRHCLKSEDDELSRAEPSVRYLCSSQATDESVLLKQLSKMRLFHESHTSILKEAHERELVSLRSYIAFLEQRRGPAPTPDTANTERDLAIDTSQSGAQARTASAAQVPTTILRSDTTADLAAEVNAVEREFSLSRRVQADTFDLHQETVESSDAAEIDDGRILQLTEVIRRNETREKAMQIAIDELEARLAGANNERLDVLEDYHEACSKVAALTAREGQLTQELEEVTKQLSINWIDPKTLAPASISNHRESIKPNHGRLDVGGGPWNEHASREIHVLQNLIIEKNARIEELEQCLSTNAWHLEKTSELEKALEEQKKVSAVAQASADRYSSLLHNEIRKQTQQAVNKAHTVSPKIEAEAFVVAADKMVRLTAHRSTSRNSGSGPRKNFEQPLPPNLLLERELEYCIKEIILYKLDVRNYRTELRKAKAKVESLSSHTNRHHVPSSYGEEASSISSSMYDPRSDHPSGLSQHPVEPRRAIRPGLGISRPDMPPSSHTVASATVDALLSIAPAAFSTSLPTPLERPRMPLDTQKRLPKPPPAFGTPSPMPAGLVPGNKTPRFEVQKSSSESVLPSEARSSSLPKRPESTPVPEGPSTGAQNGSGSSLSTTRSRLPLSGVVNGKASPRS